MNSVQLGGAYGDLKISAPRIDMTWSFKGYPEASGLATGDPPADPGTDHPDWRADTPWRRTPDGAR